MTEEEQAVIEAAKNVFGMRTIETDTGQVWRHGAACTWQLDRLFAAVTKLEGRPFIDPAEIRPPGTPTPADRYRAWIAAGKP